MLIKYGKPYLYNSIILRIFAVTKKAPVMGGAIPRRKMGLTRPRYHKCVFKSRDFFPVFQTYLV